MKELCWSLVGFILLLVLWWIVGSGLHLVDPNLLPDLISVTNYIYVDFSESKFYEHLLPTLKRWCPGFILGGFFGVVFGFILGVFRTLGYLLRGPIEFFRAIPVTALIPLIFLLTSTGDASKSLMCFIPSFLLLTVYVEEGVKNVSRSRLETFKLLRASKVRTLKMLVVPECIPMATFGLRLAFSYSLLVIIVSEMFIGANSGLGQRIYESYMYGDVVRLYSGILEIGVLGFLGSLLFLSLEKKARERFSD